jgi:hypothetical protein
MSVQFRIRNFITLLNYFEWKGGYYTMCDMKTLEDRGCAVVHHGSTIWKVMVYSATCEFHYKSLEFECCSTVAKVEGCNG